MDIMEPTQRFSRTVPCPNCGEDYSITYKRCPFCGGPPKKASKQQEPEQVPYMPSEDLFRAMLQEDDPAAEEQETIPPKFPQGVHPEAQSVPASPPREESSRPPLETVVISVGKGKADPEPETPQPAVAAVPVQPEARRQGDSAAAIPADSAVLVPAAPTAIAPARSAVAVLPTEIDLELPELNFDDIDDLEEPITPTRGGKRLEPKGRGAARSSGRSEAKRGGGAGRVIGFLFSLLIVAAAVYIVAVKAMPYIQVFMEQRGWGTTQEQEEEPAPPMEPEEVVFQLQETQVTLTAKDATQTLIPVFEGTEADPEMGVLTWKSSDENVVTVSGDGKLTAVGLGEAIVSVTRANGDMVNCQVVCQWEEGVIIPGNLYLNTDDFTLKPGESHTMKIIGTDAPVTWSIDKPNVATISESGVVKHVSKGTATITCTVGPYAVTGIVRCS